MTKAKLTIRWLQDDLSLPLRNVRCLPTRPLAQSPPPPQKLERVRLTRPPAPPSSFREKLWLVFRATRTHARNLAKFAAIYKATCVLLKRYGATPGKEGTSHIPGKPSLFPRNKTQHRRRRLTAAIKKKTGAYDTFLAGLVGGYVVFGRRSKRSGKVSSVSQQIVIYVFARVVLALARLAVKPGRGLPVLSSPGPSALVGRYAWPVFASASWGMVMYLFRWHAAELQPSLRGSMTYIYTNSEHWDGLRNFVVHNK